MTEYLKGLSDRFNVVVLSAKTPDVSHIEKYHGARLLRVPVGTGDLSSRLQAFDRAVRRQLESEEYAIVHFTDPYGGYALCELRESYGYRLIYEAQSFPSQEMRFTYPQTEGDRRFISRLKRQELFCLMNADRVVTGSPVTADFIHSLGVSADRVEVLPPPVDLGPYRPDVLGPPDNVPMKVLYLGSQVGWQGLPTLLRGMSHALKRADIRLAMVGPKHPEWLPHLKDLVEELKLSGKVEIQDPVGHDDLCKVVATCDVGVLPLEDVDRNRIQGGACAKAAEYMAGGRPVVAADLPTTRRLLPEAASLFFPPGNASDLGEHLLELAAAPARRVEMGRKARAFAETRLEAASIRGRLLDLYDELAEKPRRAGYGQEPVEEKETSIARAPRPPGPERRATDPAAVPAEPPVVLGEALPTEFLPARGTTEPDHHLDEGLPVVVGAPLREPGPVIPEPPEPAMTELEMPALAPEVLSRAGGALPPPPAVAEAGEPEEISSDEIEEAGDDEEGPTDPPADPWLAQVTQGYCPPEPVPPFRPSQSAPPTPARARPSGSRPRPTPRDDSSPGFKP
jgi:glycosyltransferase involved in cell wall biosynthesis